MTIVAFGDYINSDQKIYPKSEISYLNIANINDSITLRHLTEAIATNPFINGCSRYSASATGIIADGRNNILDKFYAQVLDTYA